MPVLQLTCVPSVFGGSFLGKTFLHGPVSILRPFTIFKWFMYTLVEQCPTYLTFTCRVDHRGVWAYLDVSYKGSFTMTIETKVTSALFQEKQVDTRMRLQNIDISYRNQPINDDESDSEPEELHLKTEQLKIGSPGTRKSGKIRSYMNSAWRAAANSRLGKRVTEKVLSYPLVLSVEVRRLDGPVVINIPPPPSDSIW